MAKHDMSKGGYIDGKYISWLGRNAVLFDEQERAHAKYLQDEWKYRVEERLGILCGTDKPADEQLLLAQREADQWVKDHSSAST